MEMETSNEMGYTGFKEGPNDDMHFSMRRLIVENDASNVSNDSPSHNSGSISPNHHLVLYHNLDKLLSNLIKVIRVQSVHATYKASDGGSRTNNSIVNLQGSLQPRSWGFILLSQFQSNMARSLTKYPKFYGKWNDDVERHSYLREAF